MNVFLGILAVIGAIAAWCCGIGVIVSLVAWIASLLGATFVTGAGSLIFKFAGGWILSVLVTIFSTAAAATLTYR